MDDCMVSIVILISCPVYSLGREAFTIEFRKLLDANALGKDARESSGMAFARRFTARFSSPYRSSVIATEVAITSSYVYLSERDVIAYGLARLCVSRELERPRDWEYRPTVLASDSGSGTTTQQR
jgi:hypothetical protein